MTGYPLARLLSARHFREDKARKAVGAALGELAAARGETERRREELERYRGWRDAEVERRYAAIMGAVLSGKELNAFTSGLAELDAGELLRKKTLEDALEAEESRTAALAAAREQAAAAARETAKIETHRDIWLRRDAAERERREERELEDARPAPASGSTVGTGLSCGKA